MVNSLPLGKKYSDLVNSSKNFKKLVIYTFFQKIEWEGKIPNSFLSHYYLDIKRRQEIKIKIYHLHEYRYRNSLKLHQIASKI